ncbi:hypothetical protein Leryth_016378 [Lithospermum erythrorhizon]|nr:hypothetical protein Leryth_016378 [Lithospermum erythrorhizon]
MLIIIYNSSVYVKVIEVHNYPPSTREKTQVKLPERLWFVSIYRVKNIMLVVTSFGGPKSRMFSLAVGITVTLTFSSGSITSLKTLSCPSTTTSWLKCRRKVMKSEQLRKCISSA